MEGKGRVVGEWGGWTGRGEELWEGMGKRRREGRRGIRGRDYHYIVIELRINLHTMIPESTGSIDCC